MSRRSKGSQRRGLARRLPWVPAIAVAAALVFGYFVLDSFQVFNAVGERLGDQGRAHLPDGQTASYTTVPPASGPHWGSGAAPWGVSPVTVPDERAVHNLEHGGIVITYNAIPEDQLRTLQAFPGQYPRDRNGQVKILVHPYGRIPAGTIVLTSWGWRERLEAFDEGRVKAFVDAHVGRCCEGGR